MGLLAAVWRLLVIGMVGLMAMWALPAGAHGPRDDRTQASADRDFGPESTPAGDLHTVKGRELIGLRTETSRTFQAPGGMRIAEVSAAPVNYRSGGEWRLIDNQLKPATGGSFVNAANRYRVALPARLRDGVRVQLGTASARLTLDGADAQVSVAGSRATYTNARPGVDVVYTMSADSVKEDLVLTDRSAPSRFVFDLQLADGLDARKNDTGGVDILSGDGRVFALAAPFALDAATSHGRATLQLSESTDGYSVTVAVDEAWLRAPDREFPVTIDPTVDFGAQSKTLPPVQDCSLDDFDPNTTFCSDDRLWAGRGDGDGSPHRSVLLFDVAGVIQQHSQVVDSELNLYFVSEHYSVGGIDVSLHQVTSPWTNSATWNNRTATNAWTSPGGDFAAAASSMVEKVGNDRPRSYAWDATALTDGWVRGSIPNNGVLMKTPEYSGDHMVTFASSENHHDPNPKLLVAYSESVYHAKHWTGDPAAGGELLSEEWAVLGSKIARRETADTIVTRTNVPCQDSHPTGPICAEVRWRTLESQFEGAAPDDVDNFMQHRGVTPEDPNVQQVADILHPASAVAVGEPVDGTGPLGNVLASWQVPPPGHGTTYDLYEVTGDFSYSNGPFDESTEEFGDGVGVDSGTIRLWVDSNTKMPIRQTLTVGTEAPVTEYWSYDTSVARPGDFPPDFFRVPEPEPAGLSQRVQFLGDEPPAEMLDTRANATFTPYTLGDRPTVAGRELCLITTLTFRQNERMTHDDFPGGDHDLSSLARIDALYAPRPAGGDCRPGMGRIEDSVLSVISVARKSGLAGAHRDSIVPRAQVLSEPPTPPQALTSRGMRMFEGPQNRAYTTPASGGGRLVLADIGGTSVLVNGDFQAREAPGLLRRLEGR